MGEELLKVSALPFVSCLNYFFCFIRVITAAFVLLYPLRSHVLHPNKKHPKDLTEQNMNT